MKRKFVICMVLLTLSFTVTAQTDLRIKKISRMNTPNMLTKPDQMKDPWTGKKMDIGKSPESTVFIKGARMLTEMRMEKDEFRYIFTRLRQCDLGRELSYNNKHTKYKATYFSSSPETTDKESSGTVTFSITYTDTGERQEMHGYTARHVKSLLITTPSPNACGKKAMKVETDGWYIDLPALSCPTFSTSEPPNQNDERSCNDKIIYQVNGKEENGFAVKETITVTLPGTAPVSMVHEVTEINRTELDTELFDVPPGYTESKDSVNKNADNISQNKDLASTASLPMNSNETSFQPKRPGIIRIGIAKLKMQTPDHKTDFTAPFQLSAAVRDVLIETLKAEKVEAIRLNSEAPLSEAKEKECDYIFYANVTQKSGGGMFGKIMTAVALEAVGVFVPGIGGIIAGTAGSVLSGQMGKAAKAKDEFTFDYKVTDLNNIVVSQAITKTKTKKNGEDVLSLQIKEASTTVLSEIAKPK